MSGKAGCCAGMGNWLSSLGGRGEGGGGGGGGGEKEPVYPVLIPTPIPAGSTVNMQKQDPSLEGFYRPVWVAEDIRPGPTSDHIQVKGVSRVRASDNSNNYIYNPTEDPEKFDAVNSFAVVNHVRTMYVRALKRIKSTYNLTWQWGDAKISVYPRAGEWANAFYSREDKVLALFYFPDQNPARGAAPEMVYTCRSFDIMAHETGHAILDALKPDYIVSNNPQTGALHEAFGDLTAIFAMLEFMDICDSIIVDTKCDLHTPGWFPKIADQFGSAIGKDFGLRNADNNLKIDEVTEEIHDLSRVFTGAVFDSLVEIFELTLNLEQNYPAETLYNTGRQFSALTISGFLKSPTRDGTFRDVADSMIRSEDNPQFRSIIKKHFERRKIYDDSARPRTITANILAEHEHICSTKALYGMASDSSPMQVKLSNLLHTCDEAYPDAPSVPDALDSGSDVCANNTTANAFPKEIPSEEVASSEPEAAGSADISNRVSMLIAQEVSEQDEAKPEVACEEDVEPEVTTQDIGFDVATNELSMETPLLSAESIGQCEDTTPEQSKLTSQIEEKAL